MTPTSGAASGVYPRPLFSAPVGTSKSYDHSLPSSFVVRYPPTERKRWDASGSSF